MADPTNYFDRPYGIVESQINWMLSNANNMIAASTEALASVASITHFDFGAYTAPTAPLLSMPDVFSDSVAIPQGGFGLPASVGSFAVPVFTGNMALTDLQNLTMPDVTAYYSGFLETLKSKVGDMLGGSLGLPSAVEAALSDRAKARVDAAGLKARQEATDAWAARGFAMPSGMLAAADVAAVAKNQGEANGIARDVYVESSKWSIESVRWAAQQAVAIEDAQMRTYQAIQGLVQSAIAGTAQIAQGNRDKAIALLSVALDKFGKELTASVQAMQTELDGTARSHDLIVRAAEAQGQLSVSKFGAEVNKGQALSQLAVSQYEVAVHEYDAQLSRLIEQVKLAQGSQLGIAQYTSQLAAGLTSAMHVGANVEGRSSISNDTNYSEHHNFDETAI